MCHRLSYKKPAVHSMYFWLKINIQSRERAEKNHLKYDADRAVGTVRQEFWFTYVIQCHGYIVTPKPYKEVLLIVGTQSANVSLLSKNNRPETTYAMEEDRSSAANTHNGDDQACEF